MATDHFCLKWNNFQNSILSAFESLQSSEDLVDVTLMCEGRNVKAHKVILSACSPYFRNLFRETPCQHPIIILKDVLHCDLLAILQFMYQGEVLISQDGLTSFLKTAELLQVSGLAGNTPGNPTLQENDTVPAKPTHSAPPLVPKPISSPSSPGRPVANKQKSEATPAKPVEKENTTKKEEKSQSRVEPEAEPMQSCSYVAPESVVIKTETDFEDMEYNMLNQENVDDPGPAEEQSILERSLKAQGNDPKKPPERRRRTSQRRKSLGSGEITAVCPLCNTYMSHSSLNNHINKLCKNNLTIPDNNELSQEHLYAKSNAPKLFQNYEQDNKKYEKSDCVPYILNKEMSPTRPEEPKESRKQNAPPPVAVVPMKRTKRLRSSKKREEDFEYY